MHTPASLTTLTPCVFILPGPQSDIKYLSHVHPSFNYPVLESLSIEKYCVRWRTGGGSSCPRRRHPPGSMTRCWSWPPARPSPSPGPPRRRSRTQRTQCLTAGWEFQVKSKKVKVSSFQGVVQATSSSPILWRKIQPQRCWKQQWNFYQQFSAQPGWTGERANPNILWWCLEVVMKVTGDNLEVGFLILTDLAQR